MAKRKKKTSSKTSKVLTYIALSLVMIGFIVSSFSAGYYFGYEEAQEDVASKSEAQKQKRLDMLKKLEVASTKPLKTDSQTTKVAKKEEIKPKVKKEESVRDKLKEVLKKDTKEYTGAAHEYDDDEKIPPNRVQREVKIVSTKPKLAIIIDDVSTSSHVNAIKSLGMPLTMSFLPPSSARPNSAKLASKEKFYMVHLPMEAQSYTAEEPFTLRVNDSRAKIFKRIKELKKIFPKVKYINNHTGSKFTSDEIAMNRLVYAMNANDIYFIDSRTTAKTKAQKVMKNYGYKYMARDVFLDHHMDKAYIKTQIKKAVKLAKLHGTAIAIGHPHANTILTLNESKKLFKDVELVYVNKLY